MPAIEPYKDQKLPERFLRWIEVLRQKLRPIPEQLEGDGSPEGVIKAPEKARYYNRTGAAGTLLYVKTTGSDVSTGWVAYG